MKAKRLIESSDISEKELVLLNQLSDLHNGDVEYLGSWKFKLNDNRTVKFPAGYQLSDTLVIDLSRVTVRAQRAEDVVYAGDIVVGDVTIDNVSIYSDNSELAVDDLTAGYIGPCWALGNGANRLVSMIATAHGLDMEDDIAWERLRLTLDRCKPKRVNSFNWKRTIDEISRYL